MPRSVALSHSRTFPILIAIVSPTFSELTVIDVRLQNLKHHNRRPQTGPKMQPTQFSDMTTTPTDNFPLKASTDALRLLVLPST
jgi:hypothetical protein